MKKLTFSLLVLISIVFIPTSQAESGAETLHNKNCRHCHDDDIYTRNNSIIESYPELQARVEFCEGMARAHWNDKQINDVINYLNDKFYKFPRN